MNWNKITIDPADSAFSKWLRLQYKKCQRCQRSGTGERGIDGLQASHFHSRRKWTTRFDPLNVDCLCAGCHRYFTEHKTEYEDWKEDQLGTQGYNLLMLRANTTEKRDFVAARIVWRKELRDLEAKLANLKE